jgi:hypothetical protein
MSIPYNWRQRLAYRLFSGIYYWLSQWWDMHPESLDDWPCQCYLCRSYGDGDE